MKCFTHEEENCKNPGCRGPNHRQEATNYGGEYQSHIERAHMQALAMNAQRPRTPTWHLFINTTHEWALVENELRDTRPQLTALRAELEAARAERDAARYERDEVWEQQNTAIRSARTVAFEEARILVRDFNWPISGGPSTNARRARVELCERLGSLAPLAPTLCVVELATIERVKWALRAYDTGAEHVAACREPDGNCDCWQVQQRAALALLDKVKP